MRLRELADQAWPRLVSAGINDQEARLDAELLLRHVLHWDRASWIVRRDEMAPGGVAESFEALVARRLGREPIAYIRGTQEFYGRDFAVGPEVLIPRPETELLIDEAMRAIADVPAARIADIGTGSGCVAITLALEVPQAIVVATDLSEAALTVARANARAHSVEKRVTFVATSLLAGVGGQFDLIATNPPYVARADRDSLAAEVVGHEPHLALFGGEDGLDVVRAIVAVAAASLTTGGALVMEIGIGQWPAVDAALAGAGLRGARVRHDLQGLPRVAVATKREE